MLIREAEFVVFDIETTGLSPQKGDRICEIGAVRIKNSEITDSFETLVNPQRDIPPQVVRIHGITSKDVISAPCFEEAAPKFLSFIKDSCLLAYNIKFDLGFFNYQLKSAGMEKISLPFVDILALCRRLIPHLPRFNLSSVAGYLGVQAESTHRGYADAYTAAQVFIKLLPSLEEKSVYDMEGLFSSFGKDEKPDYKADTDKIKVFKKAIPERLKVKIKYYSQYKDEVTEYDVFPLKIDKWQGNDILIGHCLLRGEERSFNLTRIIDIKIA